MAWEKFTSLGALVGDLELAWQDRLKDAEAALKAKRPANAIVNGLYALEIRLKVLICKRLELKQLPKAFEIHDLDALLLLSGLSGRLTNSEVISVKDNWDEIVILSKQAAELRYTPNRRWRIQRAANLLSQLSDPKTGVFQWLSTQT